MLTILDWGWCWGGQNNSAPAKRQLGTLITLQLKLQYKLSMSPGPILFWHQFVHMGIIRMDV